MQILITKFLGTSFAVYKRSEPRFGAVWVECLNFIDNAQAYALTLAEQEANRLGQPVEVEDYTVENITGPQRTIVDPTALPYPNTAFGSLGGRPGARF